ncbi:Alpha/Beta hydrolase protein [Xylariomycetidae sp. FL0641]|nr:Alpha/Beta hydrolase protein [Xylariomycetidae sp. FL0641]
MIQITEGTFEVDGASLYTKTWLPPPDVPTKAKMVMIHGYSDHINRYYDFFPTLAARGIAVYGFDQRGWGRSARRSAERGLTGPTSRVLGDIAAFLEHAQAQPPGDDSSDAAPPPPLFVCGHSMGGGEALALLCDPAYAAAVARVRGWVLESPFVGFAPELAPRRATVAAGRLAGRLLPRLQLRRPVPPRHMSRDPAVVASVAADALMHDTGTLEGLAGMLDRAEALDAGVLRPDGSRVRSLLFLHGNADRATSFPNAKAWFERNQGRVPDSKFVEYDGAYHMLHADLVKEQFYKDVGDWILERCDGAGAGGGIAEGEAQAKL